MAKPRSKRDDSIPNFSMFVTRTSIIDIFKHTSSESNDIFYNVVLSFILDSEPNDADDETKVVVKASDLRMISLVTDITGDTIADVLNHALEGLTMLFDVVSSNAVVHDANTGEEIEVIDLNNSDYVDAFDIETELDTPINTNKPVLH